MPDQEPQPRDAASELASFGEELRREREIRGISLKEISDATKISKRFLDALERNDHRTLPAPVFTRGFVREYARYVGLNAEEMVNRYNFAASNDDRIEKPPAVAKYAQAPPKDISPRPAPKRGIPPAITRIDRGVIYALLIAVALGGVVYWAVQYKRKERERAEAAEAIPVTTRAAAAPPAPVPAPKPDDSKLRMTVVATAPSWLEIEADGKTVYNETIQAGARQEFEAAEQFRFRKIGNAGGLTLTFNGTAVPTLGGDGDVVRNRIFDRAALAELRAGPQGAQ
ncbi:MAG TPA: helix-turn-helix domain-containing protein [Thermoanaerobaculia bacterium]|nr:helix-turn-helix domain-containing protein [Thermoanaerobaculia bacterium]